MWLNIAQEIREERKNFTNQFRELIRSNIANSDLSPTARCYLEETLLEEGATRYYRFSVTAANELIGFGFDLEPERITQMKFGMALMLFWLRIADRYLDSSKDPLIINQLKEYLEKGGEHPHQGDPLTESLCFVSRMLKSHGEQEGYYLDLIGPLQETTRALYQEFANLDDIKAYCESRETTGVKLADTFLAIMGFYVKGLSQNNFERFKNFYHNQFKAAMHLDTLAGFVKDYNAGIAPKPTIRNRLYVLYRMADKIFEHLLYLPRSISGSTRVLSYSAVSTYHILLDSPTKG